MDKPNDNPFTLRTCPYCADRFYGRQDVCLTCRTAIREGEALVYGRSGDDPEDEGTSFKRLTREEVLEMPRGRVAIAGAADGTAPARRLKKAQDTGTMVQVNETMSGTGLDNILKAVSGFVGAAPDVNYEVAITVKKAG